MIHYHGTPVGGSRQDAARFLRGRHAMVSHFRPDDLSAVLAYCQSFALDNGAFSVWRRGGQVDFDEYASWAGGLCQHPGFDWALVPDVIDGSPDENLALMDRWLSLDLGARSVPVWHLHEPLDQLAQLVAEAQIGQWAAVALGSSGEYATPRTRSWWARIELAMEVACDEQGRPRCRLHGLRMLDPRIFAAVPLASADSTNAAVNSGSLNRFGSYPAPTRAARAAAIADRIEAAESAAQWVPAPKQNRLFGEVGAC